MLDTITMMRVVLRVAAKGSLSAAARDLSMSATFVTKHLNAIEARLKVKLFHRTTRKLVLTGDGSSYVDLCQRILADLDEGEAALSSGNVEPEGLLRLNAPMSFGLRFVVPLLPEFRALHPRVHIELGLNDRIVDLIDEGWDMSIRIGQMSDNRLTARKLCHHEMTLCASPNYLEARGKPRTVSELREHDCLGYTLSESIGTRYWRFGSNSDIQVPVGGTFHSNSGDALAAMASAGMGIIYQPAFIVADAIRNGSLVSFELDQPMLRMGGIYAVYPSARSPLAKVRSMVDFLGRKLTTL